MQSNRSPRRVHSAEFKTQVLSECRQPGASVAAVAIAHGLNPNIVHKWLSGQGLKRMAVSAPKPAALGVPTLQFVPVELAQPAQRSVNEQATPPDIRVEFHRDNLQVTLRCAASAGPSYAALLRALADALCAA
jgi:transposase